MKIITTETFSTIERLRKGMLLFILLLPGCVYQPFLPPITGKLPQVSAKKIVTDFIRCQSIEFTATAGIIFHWRYRDLSTLCIAQVNRQTRKISVVGMNLLGVKIFSAAGDVQQAKMIFSAMQMKLEHPDDFATGMIRDIGRIYFYNFKKFQVKKRTAKQLIVSIVGNNSTVVYYTFTGNPLRLTEKKAVKKGVIRWQVRYFQYKRFGQLTVPSDIIYNNYQHDYRLTIRVKSLTHTVAGHKQLNSAIKMRIKSPCHSL